MYGSPAPELWNVTGLIATRSEHPLSMLPNHVSSRDDRRTSVSDCSAHVPDYLKIPGLPVV
jgi:hypothetical protein